MANSPRCVEYDGRWRAGEAVKEGWMGGWQRQDETEVWYFAEKSSHCLKVDGVTPRRKITSGAASINNPPLTPPREPKETRLQLFLHPHRSPREFFHLFVSLAASPPDGSLFRHPRFYPPPPLSPLPPHFTRLSVCQPVQTNNEFMELRKARRNSFASLKNVYKCDVYICTHGNAVSGETRHGWRFVGRSD